MWSSFAIATVVSLTATVELRGAVVLDLIGDLVGYDFPDLWSPLPSQVYPDFPANDCTVIEDFTASGTQLWISDVGALIFAQTGSTSFSQIEGYHVNVYSSPAAAAAKFKGDVLSAFFPPSAATVTPRTDASTGDEYGLVSLAVNLSLPAAGTYWLGISPQASYTSGGDFRVAPAATNGTNNTAAANNAVMTNPGGGFSLPGNAAAQNRGYAIMVAVPEPSAAILASLAGFLLLSRKRHAGRSIQS